MDRFADVKLLLLTPAAFGGTGGIAKFNRDLATALARLAHVSTVDILVRDGNPLDLPPPAGVSQALAPSRGRLAYVRAVSATRRHADDYDRVLCGHINLLPLARFVAGKRPIDLFIHGLDAWQRPHGLFRARRIDMIDRVMSVSRLTRDRFLDWAGLPQDRCHILPNTIDLGRFQPTPDAARDLPRQNGPVIATLARLAANERLKGIDEMFAALPQILDKHPGAIYRIGGSGDDLPRLRAQANRLGLSSHVEFLGYVAEQSKVDFYRQADAFVLAGHGEGFGIVLLEALASGLPVVASTLDGSVEAVNGGEWGEVVDPRDPKRLADAVLRTLTRTERTPPGNLDIFSVDNFDARVAALYPDTMA